MRAEQWKDRQVSTVGRLICCDRLVDRADGEVGGGMCVCVCLDRREVYDL
jgi:hypothetical protein